MRALIRIQYRLASALLVLLTFSATARADTDIRAHGTLNFFLPHGSVSLAIGEPRHRHYVNTDYLYEKRRYAPEYRKGHHNYQHNHYQQNNRYYKKAPKHYVVIQQPHKHHPVFIDHPRKDNHARHQQKNERQYSKQTRHDHSDGSKRDRDHKRDRDYKRDMKGSGNNRNDYINYRH